MMNFYYSEKQADMRTERDPGITNHVLCDNGEFQEYSECRNERHGPSKWPDARLVHTEHKDFATVRINEREPYQIRTDT